MKKLTKIGVAAALSLGFAMGTVSYAQPDGGGAEIRIQEYPGTILGLPVWVAIEKGFCANYGLKCSTVQLPSGPLGLQTLASGSIEVSYASNDVNLMAASRGNNVQLVVGHTPNNYYTLNVSKDYPLPNIDKGYPAVMQDLKGAKLGVTARGASIEMVMRGLLQSAGMSGDDVTYVAVGAPATSYPAMLAKQIDATVSFEPFNTLCLAQDTCIELVSPGKGEGPEDMLAMNGGFASYVMRTNFIKEKPEVADAFIATMQDTMAWMRDPNNFDELASVALSKISLGDMPDGDKLMLQLVKGQADVVGAKIDRQAIDATSDFLLHHKLIQNPVSSASFVYEKAPTS